ncbi:hypothetical protein CFP56_023060 [Quercus suber]|uniref:Uncharacterized protein n=1 Tax=Quercus suber TaxID=58331 RepID=A0AAW0K9U4_QUESU
MALVVQEKLMNPAEPDDIVEFPKCWCFTVVAKKWFVLILTCMYIFVDSTGENFCSFSLFHHPMRLRKKNAVALTGSNEES